MGVGLSLLLMIASLFVEAVAIFVLARRVGFSLLIQLSGFLATGFGLATFIVAPNFLPFSPTRYAELLGFGVAYLGQSLLVLWLGIKGWPIVTQNRGLS